MYIENYYIVYESTEEAYNEWKKEAENKYE